jgi:hypothetical protein
LKPSPLPCLNTDSENAERTGFVDEMRKLESNRNQWEGMKVSRGGVTGRKWDRKESIFILSLTRLPQKHISAPSNLSTPVPDISLRVA